MRREERYLHEFFSTRGCCPSVYRPNGLFLYLSPEPAGGFSAAVVRETFTDDPVPRLRFFQGGLDEVYGDVRAGRPLRAERMREGVRRESGEEARFWPDLGAIVDGDHSWPFPSGDGRPRDGFRRKCQFFYGILVPYADRARIQPVRGEVAWVPMERLTEAVGGRKAWWAARQCAYALPVLRRNI